MMFKLVKNSQLLILASFMTVVATWVQATPYLYYEPYQDWTVVTAMKGRARCLAMEIDSAQVTHVLFAIKTAQSGDNLYYTNDSSWLFAEPMLIYNAPGGFNGLISGIDASDVIHLVWQGHTNGFLGNIEYAKVIGGQVTDAAILYENEDTQNPDLAVDGFGDAHVCFDLLVENTVALAYIRSVNSLFQPMVTTFFDPESVGTYRSPQLCIDQENTVYFFSFNFQVVMIKFRNENFEPAIQLCSIEGAGGDKQRVIRDNHGVIHLFFTEDSGKLVYMKSDDGITFTAPYFLTLTLESGIYYRYVSEPQVHEDGSVMVVTYHYEDNGSLVSLEGYYQLDRGDGFGNPKWIGRVGTFYSSSDDIAPAFQLSAGDVLSILDAKIIWNEDYNDYQTELKMLMLPPRIFTEPWLYIHSLDDDFDHYLDRFAWMRVTLDINNPTDQALNVDLVMATSFSILPDVYYFLCGAPSYPSFQLDYYGFPAVIPAGSWYQNIEIFGMDLHVIDPAAPSFSWYWYAALIDRQTGTMVGDLSVGHSVYTQ